MDLTQFYFFDLSDNILFVRTDAESAAWQVDELTLNCVFPYDPDRIIVRGMRIGFRDAEGVLQPFEVRNVRMLEPDHYQQLICEHIVISELTDVHTSEQELDNVLASSALSACLAFQPSGMTGAARWEVGTVTSSGTSSGDIGMGSVWQNIRNVEQNWNVYILPRVTFNASGITGRYLDIVPAQGTWHGVRLSVDKNMDEVGVTIDDTEVKTALYGYGGTKYKETANHLDKTGQKIDLVGYNWTNPPSGCSKPTNAAYVLDTNANALYSRNGQPRFGFYQNADIDDQATLAQKTWEALQTVNKPQVTVDCMVCDLYRMGYHDEPIRLHDTVMVEIKPINDILTLEVIKLSVDLLNPTATRPTIGAYIPNIVYIQRETRQSATGGASSRISGQTGGENADEAKWSEFMAEYKVNNTLFSYHATQIDHDMNVLRAAGLDITAQGVLIYAEDNLDMIGSRFHTQADQIAMVVGTNQDGNYIKAGEISLAINDENASTAYIRADHVLIEGNTVFANDVYVQSAISALRGDFDDLVTGRLTATLIYTHNLQATISGSGSSQTGGYISGTTIYASGQLSIGSSNGGTFYFQGKEVTWKSMTVVKSASVTTTSVSLGSSHNFLYETSSGTQATVSGQLVAGYSRGSASISTDTIYYLGRSV